jgi:hypothetical protein
VKEFTTHFLTSVQIDPKKNVIKSYI